MLQSMRFQHFPDLSTPLQYPVLSGRGEFLCTGPELDSIARRCHSSLVTLFFQVALAFHVLNSLGLEIFHLSREHMAWP